MRRRRRGTLSRLFGWDGTFVGLFALACALTLMGEPVRAQAGGAPGRDFRDYLRAEPRASISDWPLDRVDDNAAVHALAFDSTEIEVRTLLEEQVRAWNRGDLEGFMAGYWNSPELLFTSGGAIQRGYDAVLDSYRGNYGSGKKMGVLEFSDLQVHSLGTEAAWAIGTWKLDRAGAGSGGIFTLVFRRIGGALKIVHDHTSTWTRPATASPASPKRHPSARQAIRPPAVSHDGTRPAATSPASPKRPRP